ncbi:interferon-inducible GTPase-domain-containing protein, partial [Sphaerosporella brunnea]
PTEEEVAEAEKRIQYRKENLHFAVAGTTGTGKSSLINAFRRLRDYDVKKGAARTGTSETTKGIGRYPDPDPELPRRRFIWYDLPGAGSQDIDDWEYFKKQQLFVFDLVIVVISGRFRKCDAILLQHCTRLDVPTFLVRSKSDQEIAAIHKQMEQEDNPDSSDDEDSDDDSPVTIHSEPPKNYYREARKKYISEARQNSREELAKAGIPDQHLYLVTNEGIHLVSKYLGKKDISSLRKATKATYERLIDEEALVRDLLHAAYKRR